MKLRENTVRDKMAHGGSNSSGFEFICSLALLIMTPQLGVGVLTPIPKKLRVLSARMEPARSIIVTARRMPDICGSRCLKIR